MTSIHMLQFVCPTCKINKGNKFKGSPFRGQEGISQAEHRRFLVQLSSNPVSAYDDYSILYTHRDKPHGVNPDVC